MSPINCYFFFRDSKRGFLVSNRQLHFEYSFRIATQFILKCLLLDVFNLLFVHFNGCRREESKCKISWFFELYIYFKIPVVGLGLTKNCLIASPFPSGRTTPPSPRTSNLWLTTVEQSPKYPVSITS